MTPDTPPAGAPPHAPPPEDESFSHWRRNRAALAVGTFCNTLGFTVSFPYLPLIVRELGVAQHLETWVGLVVGGFFTVSFFLTPVWGTFADHFGRRSMVLRAGLGMAVGFSLLAVSGGLPLFLLFFVLVGTCNGYVPASFALVATSTPTRFMGRALATVQTGALLGITCGPAVGAFLTGVLPAYRDLFWVSAAMTLTAGSVALLFARERHQRPPGPFRPAVLRDSRAILAVRGMPVLFSLNFIFSVTMFGSTTIISLYILEMTRRGAATWGLPVETWVGVATLALTIASAVAVPVWGRGLDRFEPGRVLAVGLATGTLASLLFPLVNDPLQLTGARIVLGLLAVGIQPGVVRLVKAWSPAGMDARSLALGTALQMLGNGAAPLAAGMIGPWLGLRAYFGLNAALLAAGLLLWLLRGLPAAALARSAS